MNEFLEVGKITNTHGLRGEIKVVAWTDYPDAFEDIKTVYINSKSGQTEHKISSVKYQKNNIILKLKGLDTIEEAEKLKNKILLCERSELGELPDGVYYIADLIGLSVVTDEGEELGKIKDVINTGANDIYVVAREGMKDLLIPVIETVVNEVSLEDKKVTVTLPEGLLDL